MLPDNVLKDVMKKAEFNLAVRDKLEKVPYEIRKTWTNKELLQWWEDAIAQDSYLRWEKCHGPLWQHVKGVCSNLIGKKAFG